MGRLERRIWARGAIWGASGPHQAPSLTSRYKDTAHKTVVFFSLSWDALGWEARPEFTPRSIRHFRKG